MARIMINLRRLKPALFLVLSVLAFTVQVNAQVSLGVTKSTNVTSPVEPGDSFQYIIQYTCISTTQACMDAVVTDVLPVGLDWGSSNVQLIPSVHVASSNYNQSSHTVTFTMVSPLAAGSTGELRIGVQVASNAADGLVIDNTATFDASNAPAVSDNAVLTVSNPPILESLKINKSDPSVTLDSNIQYNITLCNEQNGAVQNNVTLVDTLPSDAQFVSATGGGVYNSGSNTVTWFAGTMNPGECFNQSIVVQYPSSSYNPGDCVTNDAEFTATPVGGSEYSGNDDETSCFPLPPKVSVNKSDPNVVLDENVIYSIEVCNPSGGQVLTSLTMVDDLPPNSVFVNATNGGTYNSSNHTVSWNIGPLAPGSSCFNASVTVLFPSPPFQVGNCVTNDAIITVVPQGGSQYTRHDDESDCFEEPFQMDFDKRPDGGTVDIGDQVHFRHKIENDGTDPLTNVVLVDTVPNEVEVFQITTHHAQMNTNEVPVQVHYQTNLNSSWQLASSFAVAPSKTINVSTLGLASGEVISKIRWTYGPLPDDFSSSPSSSTSTGFYCTILANEWVSGSTSPGPVVLPGTVITNSSTITGDGFPSETDTGHVTVRDPANDIAEPFIVKGFNGPTQLVPGGMTSMGLVVGNDGDADIAYTSPYVVTDLLPATLKYVQGTQSSPVGTTFEEIPDYNGTGRTLLRWTLPAGFDIAPGQTAPAINLDVMTLAGIPAGTITNTAGVSNSAVNSVCNQGSETDTDDLDGDSDTSDVLCTDSATLEVLTVAAMESIKWVKGQLDADYSRYPEVGNTVPGGLADYRLIVKNVGSVSMTDIMVIDILPWIGDVGVLDPSPRDTEWRPNLVGAVVPSDPAITVYYSTEENPCRTELNFSPPGCTPGNWTTTTPGDITSIQSLKFDFNNIVVAPGDSLVLEWPMRAPLSAPVNNLVAWNSFGFIASRADDGTQLLASEPIKVGIAITGPPEPIVLGDFVWFDENCNGIQDDGEIGLNGFRVDAYLDDGDGIAEPGGEDTFVAFTVTGNDFFGNPGFYLFSSLPAGSYFLVFTPPPGSNFIPSPQMQGTNVAVDSDPNDQGVTPVVSYPPAADTRDIDAGFCDAGTPLIDLSLVKTVSDSTPTAGGQTVFTITVTNAGPETATGVAVTDVLPAGLPYVSHTGGVYNPVSGVWTIGSLAASASATLLITVSTPNVGTFNNCAEVSDADQVDADSVPNDGMGDDYDCEEVVVQEPAIDVELEKTADKTVVVPGDTVVFTLKVSNVGQGTAMDVAIQDNLPPGVTYVSDDGNGAYNSGTGIWTVGNLGPGAMKVLKITVTVD